MPRITKRGVPPAETIKPERGPFVLLDLNSTDTKIQAAVSVLMGRPND
jgi:hypothetical protein